MVTKLIEACPDVRPDVIRRLVAESPDKSYEDMLAECKKYATHSGAEEYELVTYLAVKCGLPERYHIKLADILSQFPCRTRLAIDKRITDILCAYDASMSPTYDKRHIVLYNAWFGLDPYMADPLVAERVVETRTGTLKELLAVCRKQAYDT